MKLLKIGIILNVSFATQILSSVLVVMKMLVYLHSKVAKEGLK